MNQPSIITRPNGVRYWYSICPWNSSAGAPAPMDLRTDTSYGGVLTWSYGDFAPEEMQKPEAQRLPLHIHAASIQIIGMQIADQDEAGLVIESPWQSQKWMKLANAISGANGGYDRQRHDPSVVTMYPGCNLCLARAWSKVYKDGGLTPAPSWMFRELNQTAIPRLWTATLEYTIGP